MNAIDSAESWGSTVIAYVTTQGIDILAALVLLVVGWWAIGVFKRAFGRFLERSDRMDPIVEQFLASLAYYGLVVVLVIAILSLMGVQTTSLIAILGAASLAVGLALQGSLTSLAAGVMIILLRPIRIGDYVEVNGQAGTVKSISLFLTELATYDNVQKLVPNSEVWGNTVTNYSVYATRMLDIAVGIDYDDPIDDALTVLRRVAESNEAVLADPAPAAFVDTMGESSVDLKLRVWVGASDYWPMRRALTKQVKEEIEKAGMSIPYPHRQIAPAKGDATPANDDAAAA